MGKLSLGNAIETRQRNALGGYEATPGYTVNGEGEWSRHAASGGSVDTTPAVERMHWSRLDVMVQHEQQVVARLERRVAAGDASAAPKLAKTRVLLERLRAEQRANGR